MTNEKEEERDILQINIAWRTKAKRSDAEAVETFLNEFAADLAMVAAQAQEEGVFIDNRILMTLEEYRGDEQDPDMEVPPEFNKMITELNKVIEEEKAKNQTKAMGEPAPVPHERYEGGRVSFSLDTINGIDDERALARKQAESDLLESDEYQRGVYNGLEMAMAELDNRPPNLRMPSGVYRRGRMLKDRP